MGTKAPGFDISSSLFPRSRREVLALLYSHPDQRFYLREVATLTGLGLGQIQRELNRLSEAGILRRTEEGRHVYFQADPQCPIYDELHGLVTKTAGAVDVLRNALQALRPRIVVAWIFGSVARGEETRASDLDLLVVGDVSFSDLVEALTAAEERLRREVNVSVYSTAEFRARLADGNHFLRSLIRNEKVFVFGSDDELAELLREPLDQETPDLPRRDREPSGNLRS